MTASRKDKKKIRLIGRQQVDKDLHGKDRSYKQEEKEGGTHIERLRKEGVTVSSDTTNTKLCTADRKILFDLKASYDGNK